MAHGFVWDGSVRQKSLVLSVPPVSSTGFQDEHITIGIDDPRDAIYVGDTLEDMYSATSAGLNFLGIDRGFVSRQQFEAVGALCIASLSELVLRNA